MSRHVWPAGFQLFSRGLTEAKPERIRDAMEKAQSVDPKPVRFGEQGMPIALRWFTLPALGFPRQPFQVFRRFGRFPQQGIAANSNVNGSTVVEWGRVNMFQVVVNVAPTAGSSITLTALDRLLRPIPGQTIAVAANTRCRFRVPGVAALRVTGNGTLANIQGSTANECANVEDWELIEAVGFPFDGGEIGAPHYGPIPQGYAPPSANGRDAAKMRLLIATLLHQPLPPTGIATIPTPNWPPPDPSAYLEFLRADGGSVLPMIAKCLSSTSDGNPEQLQGAFQFAQQRAGIRQADIPGATPAADPTVFTIPVVGLTMLAVSSEPYAATALGYGTIDFPPNRSLEIDATEPPGFHTDFEYMVTNTYTLVDGRRLELAALAHGRPDPQPAAALTAARLHRNRALSRDENETESVQLAWDHPLLPQGYAVAISRKAGQSALLNSPRPFPHGFELFTPPSGENVEGGPPDGRITFTDPVSEVPVSGSRQSEYLVAAGDVFGRWSGWSRSTYVATAPPIQLPSLHSVTTALDATTAVGRRVTGTLIIEFSWDWTDRSVSLIEFHGRFYTPTATPPAFAPNIQLNSTAAEGAPVIVSFDPSGSPFISSGHDGTVEHVTPIPPGATRRYRLTIRSFQADFAATFKLSYAAFARAEERIRPGERSDPAGPRTTDMFDPLPPGVPVITADLRWTALPDAANRARGVLTWPLDPHALGYVVWEATETALRRAIDPDLPAPAPEVSLPDRALALATLLAAEDARTRSSIAFTRVNTTPLTANRAELELPGGSSTLYAYRISSVSAANQESAKSPAVAWFGVPRRIKPGQPSLRVRAVEGGFEVTVVAAPGPVPAGYNLSRVRNAALLAGPGMTGPSKVAFSDAAWQDLVIDGASAKRLVDPVNPSWQPYYYQAVAIGQENVAAGELPGESAPSTTIAAFLPPSDAPALTLVSSSASAETRLIIFRSNVPAKPSDLGVATIEVVEFVREPADGPLQRRSLITTAALDVPLAPPLLVPPVGAMPPLLTRSNNTPDGFTEFCLVVPVTVTRAVIVARDPKLRMSELPLAN